jgi:anti-anti-sigma regulatory factor
MEKIGFKKSLNDQGQITGLEISGMLVLENSHQLKKEFADTLNGLSNKIRIAVSNVEEIDLSCIQVFIAFIECLDNSHVTYQFDWNLEKDQRILLENVGLSNELFMNN